MQRYKDFEIRLTGDIIRLVGVKDKKIKQIALPEPPAGKRLYIGDGFLRGSNVNSLALSDAVSYVNPRAFDGCYCIKSIEVTEKTGEKRFYTTLITAIGDKTIAISGGKSSFKYLLDTEQKELACVRLLESARVRFDEQIIWDYFYKRSTAVLVRACEMGSVGAVVRAQELKRVTKDNVDRFIAAARNADKKELVAQLVDYKEKRFGHSDVFSDMMRALTRDPFSPENIKKSFSFKYEGEAAVITAKNGRETDIFLPERIGKKREVQIGDHAFSPAKRGGYRQDALAPEKVHLNKVSIVGEGAFCGLKELKTVVMPYVRKIPKECFKDCASLENIDFSGVQSIGERAFYGTSSLKKADLSSLKELGSWAFFSSGIEELTLPAMETLPELCFSRCNKLKSVHIPKGVKVVGNRSFYECRGIEEITFDAGVEKIIWEAFAGLTGLKKLTIPGTVKVVGNQAFHFCNNLTELTLSEGIESLEWGAFLRCGKLKSVRLPRSLKHIDSHAFTACYDLKEVHIPEEITDIGAAAFNACHYVRIFGKKGSYAQEYAWIYGFPFIEEKEL